MVKYFGIDSDNTSEITKPIDIEDIEGLQSELDGKSSTNHNHNLADLAEKSYNSLTDKPSISSLPSGTINQTLRHNGTDWVADANVLSYKEPNGENTDYSFGLFENNNFEIPYITMEILHSEEGNAGTININTDNSSLNINNNLYLESNSVFKVTNNINNEFLDIYQNGKITSSYLSGNGTKPLVADNDGNISKSATAFSNTYNESRVLTEDRSNVSVTATQLGLTGTDLRTLPILAKVYFNDDDPSWVEFTQTVIIAETSVILWFPETLLSGRIVKICIFFGA